MKPFLTALDLYLTELEEEIASVSARVAALEAGDVPPPDEPDPEPEPFEWTPTTAQNGYRVAVRPGKPNEAYAQKFIISADEPTDFKVVVSELHWTEGLPKRAVDGVWLIQPEAEYLLTFNDTEQVELTVTDGEDKNVPLIRVEATNDFTVVGAAVDVTPTPVPPAPTPPNTVTFGDMPSSFNNNTRYVPEDPMRVYTGADLTGTENVTLEGVRFQGPHSSSRYSGAILPGKGTTLYGIKSDGSKRLVVEIREGADDVTIDSSTFVNGELNAIWAHAYYRTWRTTIKGCIFRNNNTRREALNWDASDVKLLHALESVVEDNDFQGSFGEGCWYDSDAMGVIRNNKFKNYMRAIHVEMAWDELGTTLVEGNIIDNCANDPRGWVWAGAILLSGSTGVTVKNNEVRNSASGMDYVELGFDHSVRSPHHSTDTVHARYGETHVEWTGKNTIHTYGADLYRGGYPTWHLPDTSTYVLGGGRIIDR